LTLSGPVVHFWADGLIMGSAQRDHCPNVRIA